MDMRSSPPSRLSLITWQPFGPVPQFLYQILVVMGRFIDKTISKVMESSSEENIPWLHSHKAFFFQIFLLFFRQSYFVQLFPAFATFCGRSSYQLLLVLTDVYK